MVWMTLWLCLVLWMTCVGATLDEERLYADLFRQHNPVLRPVANASHPVVVTIGAAIQIVMDMDERNQLLTTSVWMRFSWQDVHLRWDPEDYGGTTSLVVPFDNIWRPDIVLYNNADSEFRGMIDTSPKLTHAGVVYWNAPALYKSSCRIDVSFFPFDEQRCNLKFGSWSYDATGIDVVNRSVAGDMAVYKNDGEWDVIEMPVRRNVVYYNCCQAPFPDITFTVVLRRRSHFYIFNLIVPCILVSIVTALNFLLPADSGEKIGLVLTVLLALTVFLLLVADTIPRSDATPIIGKYFIAIIFVNSLSVFMTIFVLHLHFRLPGVSPVPIWLRKLAFVTMAPLLCVQVAYDRGKPVQPAEYNGKRLGLKQATKNRKKKSWWISTAEDSTDFTELTNAVASINTNLYTLVTRYNEQDADEDIVTQWKYVAVVFDRFFFVVYIILTVMTTLLILCQSNTPQNR